MDKVEPKPGDLIEIYRGTFYHWAIYVGDGYVIHLAPAKGLSKTGSSSKEPVLSEKAIVKKESLSNVVGTNTFCVKNLLDNKYEPRNVSDILSDAESWVGQKLTYNVIQYNCEHFVTQLRYGKPESRQVRQAADVAGPAAFVGGLLGAFATISSVIVMRLLRIS